MLKTFNTSLAMEIVGMPLADAIAYLERAGYRQSQPRPRPPYSPELFKIHVINWNDPAPYPHPHDTYSVVRRDGIFKGCECNPMIAGCIHLEVNFDHVVAAFPHCQNGQINAWEEGRNITGPNEEAKSLA